MRNKRFYDSVFCALHGIGYTLRSQRNFRFHTLCSLIAIGLGIYFALPTPEWIALSFSIVLVLIAELINTGIEVAVDLATKKTRYRARLSKDVAAGAVLLASVNAGIIGYLLFYKRLATLLLGG